MHPAFLPHGHCATTVPVTFVNAATWRGLRERLDARARAFADAAGFEPKAGRHLLLPAADGALAGVLFALESEDDAGKDLFWPGALAPLLPAGAYRFPNAPPHLRPPAPPLPARAAPVPPLPQPHGKKGEHGAARQDHGGRTLPPRD